MRFGVYLKGGGAKGAFQAGVLCALWQRGVRYNVVAGTSIGAVNGWFVVHNEFEALQNLYNQYQEPKGGKILSGLTVDNEELLSACRKIKSPFDPAIHAFYINYVDVRNGKLKEVVQDLKVEPPRGAVEKIGWSSLLPYNQPEQTLASYRQAIAQGTAKDSFEEDLPKGLYNGKQLDGGLVNNQLIRQALDHGDQIFIIIGYSGTRQDYIRDLDLTPAQRERILYIASDEPFNPEDTLAFTPEFLKKRFQEGYDKGFRFPILSFK